jgi:hypothetical protein
MKSLGRNGVEKTDVVPEKGTPASALSVAPGLGLSSDLAG